MQEFEIYTTSISPQDQQRENPFVQEVNQTEIVRQEDISVNTQRESWTAIQRKEILEEIRRNDTEEKAMEQKPQLQSVETQEQDNSVYKVEVEEGVVLEEGFASLEAQDAYYEFFEALETFDTKSGKGTIRLKKAMDTLEQHFEQLSLSKLFSVLAATLGKLLSIWGEQKENSSFEDISNDFSMVEDDDIDTADKEKPLEVQPIQTNLIDTHEENQYTLPIIYG
jgi:hypothetical protein